MTDESSNNVISFTSRKALRDAGPAIDYIVKFNQLHSERLDQIHDILQELIEDMIEEFKLPLNSIHQQDVIMLAESMMSFVMRAQGIEHPLMHSVTDELFLE